MGVRLPDELFDDGEYLQPREFTKSVQEVPILAGVAAMAVGGLAGALAGKATVYIAGEAWSFIEDIAEQTSRAIGG